jgi:hypothetical protein
MDNKSIIRNIRKICKVIFINLLIFFSFPALCSRIRKNGTAFSKKIKKQWKYNNTSDIISDIISNNTNEMGGEQWIKKYTTAM